MSKDFIFVYKIYLRLGVIGQKYEQSWKLGQKTCKNRPLVSNFIGTDY